MRYCMCISRVSSMDVVRARVACPGPVHATFVWVGVAAVLHPLRVLFEAEMLRGREGRGSPRSC